MKKIGIIPDRVVNIGGFAQPQLLSVDFRSRPDNTGSADSEMPVADMAQAVAE
jgi:hypothetical protein